MPSVFGNAIDNEQLLYDSIVQIVQIGAAMYHVCYSLFTESNCSRTFVCRKRWCVSDIFKNSVLDIPDVLIEWLLLIFGLYII